MMTYLEYALGALEFAVAAMLLCFLVAFICWIAEKIQVRGIMRKNAALYARLEAHRWDAL